MKLGPWIICHKNSPEGHLITAATSMHYLLEFLKDKHYLLSGNSIKNFVMVSLNTCFLRILRKDQFILTGISISSNKRRHNVGLSDWPPSDPVRVKAPSGVH